MTKSVALAVQRDVNSQMESIGRLADILEKMIAEAREDGNSGVLESAEKMAAELASISQKAYAVGTAVIDNVA